MKVESVSQGMGQGMDNIYYPYYVQSILRATKMERI